MTDIPDRIEELKRKRDSEGLNEQESKELAGLTEHPEAPPNDMPDPRTHPQPPQ